jgi:hypothetical protein
MVNFWKGLAVAATLFYAQKNTFSLSDASKIDFTNSNYLYGYHLGNFWQNNRSH